MKSQTEYFIEIIEINISWSILILFYSIFNAFIKGWDSLITYFDLFIWIILLFMVLLIKYGYFSKIIRKKKKMKFEIEIIVPERDLTLYKTDENENITEEITDTHNETLEALRKDILNQVELFFEEYFEHDIYESMNLSDQVHIFDDFKAKVKLK